MAKSYSFWIKCGLAALLVGLCDQLMLGSQLGAGFGVCALAGVAVLIAARPTQRRSVLAWSALAIATILALLEIDNGGVSTFLLFAVAVTVAALATRAGAADDAWRWLQRLLMGWILALWGPIGDLKRLLKVRARRAPLKLTALLLAAIVPVVGAIVFLWLFAIANPVIETTLLKLDLGQPDIGRILFAGFVAVSAWGLLRPRGLRRTWGGPRWTDDIDLPGVTTASVTVSLVVFNALFALQNGLDIAFLWSGARLPGHLTMADYAHRGAYPLIVTALLAGLFVLLFLRPGTPTGQAKAPRVLVSLWVGQNLLLVLSSLWRTANYIQAYSLTRVRIAALIWMALVGLGLALILWRLLKGKSASWLINANVLAAGAVLLACSAVDLGAIAAEWNVTHAREVGGRGEPLDLCYLRGLHGDAIVPLARLEGRSVSPDFRARVERVQHELTARIAEGGDWRGWRWRDARRVQEVRRLVGLEIETAPTTEAGNCDCDPGCRQVMQRAIAPQLTPPAQPGH